MQKGIGNIAFPLHTEDESGLQINDGTLLIYLLTECFSDKFDIYSEMCEIIYFLQNYDKNNGKLKSLFNVQN